MQRKVKMKNEESVQSIWRHFEKVKKSSTSISIQKMRIGQANDKSKARVLKMISEATVQKEELIGSKITRCALAKVRKVGLSGLSKNWSGPR